MCTRIGDALSRHVGTAQHCHPTSALIPPVIRSSALQRSLLSTLHPCNSSHRHHISHRFPASAQRGSHPRPGGMLEAAGDLCHSTGSLLAPSSPQSHSRAPANPSTHASNGSAAEPAPSLSCGLDPAFSAAGATDFTLAIIGDLHLERRGADKFAAARRQLRELLEGERCARIVQLGDLGGYNDQPGSQRCFEVAAEYLDGFLPVPSALVVGNHDLEGAEFDSDAANLAAWARMFQQRHYWAFELGRVVCIGISTVRFRSNQYSAHEVHIDDEQLAWFKATLAAAGGRPVVVFSHAPPQGCGLTVIQSVHVKNRCAFLNHSSNAGEFMALVHAHPNIRLWFSGHFHLSHNYVRSISVAGRCAFVQTGVIGDCNRDGFRHSRLLRGTQEGFQLLTVDHGTGRLRLDLESAWDAAQPPAPLLPPDGQRCDSEDEEAWPFGADGACTNGSSNGSGASTSGRADEHFAWERPANGNGGHSHGQKRRWWPAGAGRALSLEDGMLVEYDIASRAPVGLVFLAVGEGEQVLLVGCDGLPLSDEALRTSHGDAAATVQLQAASGTVSQNVARNPQGGFFQVFQHNKWRIRKAREAATAAASQRPVAVS